MDTQVSKKSQTRDDGIEDEGLGESSSFSPRFASLGIMRHSGRFCPGMYNALSGIGGGGQLDTTTTAKGHIALASVSAFGNIFIAPIVTNILGPKWTIFIGGIPLRALRWVLAGI
ncbi:hypothetical protein N7454_001669 [Penicillium verhagenii]|nr:hypothetical protein N7454_001669 [Penicillium verhagenii]